MSTTAKKPKFTTRFNFVPELFSVTKITDKSVTVPNDVYTVRELLRRFASGHPRPEMRDEYFNEELSIPVYGDRDFVDVMLDGEQLKSVQEQLRQSIKDEVSDLKKRAAERAANLLKQKNDEFEKELASRRQRAASLRQQAKDQEVD